MNWCRLWLQGLKPLQNRGYLTSFVVFRRPDGYSVVTDDCDLEWVTWQSVWWVMFIICDLRLGLNAWMRVMCWLMWGDVCVLCHSLVRPVWDQVSEFDVCWCLLGWLWVVWCVVVWDVRSGVGSPTLMSMGVTGGQRWWNICHHHIGCEWRSRRLWVVSGWLLNGLGVNIMGWWW